MSIDREAFNAAVQELNAATIRAVNRCTVISPIRELEIFIEAYEAVRAPVAEQPMLSKFTPGGIGGGGGGYPLPKIYEQPVGITALQKIAEAAVSSSPDAHYLGNVARRALGMEPLPKKEKMP